jgi:hypothetical protein
VTTKKCTYYENGAQFKTPLSDCDVITAIGLGTTADIPSPYVPPAPRSFGSKDLQSLLDDIEPSLFTIWNRLAWLIMPPFGENAELEERMTDSTDLILIMASLKDEQYKIWSIQIKTSRVKAKTV